MTYKPDFSPEGDMARINQSTFTQDFHIMPTEEVVRGIYYTETHRSLVFVGRHENIEDLINTCVHETIHGLIKEEVDESKHTDFNIDVQQEHWVIRQMCWAPESLVD